MAFIDHDMAEIIHRVKRGKKVGVALLGINAKSLVGRHVNACVLGVVCVVRLSIDLGGVGAEDVLKGTQSLQPQFVAVANKERSLKLAGVGDALENVYRNESLARSRGKREQRALWRAGVLTASDLFQHGSNGGVLVIAPGCFAPRVANE